jgi:competence protein ComEA
VFDRPASDSVRVFGALTVAVVVGVIFGRPTAPPSFDAISAPPVERPLDSVGVLTVHVSGAVTHAGLVEVSERSRVADVIAAAGGATDVADLSRVNLAEPVSDGQRIVIPVRGSEKRQGSPPDDGGSESRIRLNDADVAELEALPGVGPVLAEKIVAYRLEFGPFSDIEDLLDVSGIGERKLASLRDLVVVP